MQPGNEQRWPLLRHSMRVAKSDHDQRNNERLKDLPDLFSLAVNGPRNRLGTGRKLAAITLAAGESQRGYLPDCC